MALKPEVIAKLAALAKISAADLTKAITEKEEVDVPVPDGLQTFLEPELATLKKNQYDTGKAAGEEMAVKSGKEEFGLEFTGKTMKGLIQAAQAKAVAEAGQNPDARVKDLQTKVENLQTTVKGYETQIAEKDTAMSGLRDTYELGKHVVGAKEGGPSYSNDEIIHLMKMNGYDFKRNDKGVLEPFKNGEKMLDKLSNAQPVADVIKGFQKERKYISEEEETPGGRGGGNKPGGGKATKQSDIKAKFLAEGKSLNGEEYSKAVEAAVTADPNFDVNG